MLNILFVDQLGKWLPACKGLMGESGECCDAVTSSLADQYKLMWKDLGWSRDNRDLAAVLQEGVVPQVLYRSQGHCVCTVLPLSEFGGQGLAWQRKQVMWC